MVGGGARFCVLGLVVEVFFFSLGDYVLEVVVWAVLEEVCGVVVGGWVGD